MCDTDILLGGFGLFGGRGEYYGRIKVGHSLEEQNNNFCVHVETAAQQT